MQYDNIDENNGGITLGQLFSVVFGRKILLAVITVVILIVGTLGYKFMISDPSEQYQARFEYNIQGFENSTYIDGSQFNYRELISYDNLLAIKESNPDFSSINVEKLCDNNAIKIDLVTEYTTIGSNTTNEISAQYYKITVYKSYFSSKKQARNFIEEICLQPLNITKKLTTETDYTTNLINFDSSVAYENKITYLQNQLDFLNKKYEALIDFYGDVQYEGKKLSNILSEVNIYFENNSLDNLYQEAIQNGYVNGDAQKSQLETEKATLLDEKKLNTNTIAALTAERQSLIDSVSNMSSGLQNLDLSVYNQKIAELTIRNSEIDYQIEVINRKLGIINQDGVEVPNTTTNKSTLEQFVTKLNESKLKMEEFTNIYTEAERQVITEYSKVYYHANSIIIQSEGTSIALVAACFLVVGVVVGCVVNLCLDYKKLTPKKESCKEEISD